MIIRKIQALFTLNTDATQFKKATSELDNLSKKAENLMRTVAGFWAVQAIQNFVTNTAIAMTTLDKTAAYLGITAQALAELRYAAEKSGVSIDVLEDSLKELQIRGKDALSGSGEAFDAFNSLGLKTTDAAGRMREPLELLSEVADKLNELPTPNDRLWVVDSMFGDQGAKMLLLLEDGSVGLKNMRDEARRMGVGLSKEAVGSAIRFTEGLNKMKTGVSGLSGTLVSSLYPVLSLTMEKIGDWTSAINQAENRASITRMTIISLLAILGVVGRKLGRFAIPFLAPFILPALKFIAIAAAIILIVEDLWVAFKGGHSVIAMILNEAFGPFLRGTVHFIQEAFRAVKKAFWDLYNTLGSSFSMAWKSMSTEFGKFSTWLEKSIATLSARVKETLADLVPDFLKSGFSSTLKAAQTVYHYMKPLAINNALAPRPLAANHQNRISSNQSINVAVNVKTGANPQEISGEVSKALRKEMEKERLNAFMGVSQYAF